MDDARKRRNALKLFPDYMNVTATAQSNYATYTQSVKSSQSTMSAISTSQVATQQAYIAMATYVASFKDITLFWKDLATYSDKYAGQRVFIRGTIFNLMDRNSFQMYLAGTYQPFVIVTDSSFNNLYENDYVTVYGTVHDSPGCGTHSFGVEKCYAQIDASEVVK